MAATPFIAQQHLRVELDNAQNRFNLYDDSTYIGFVGFRRDGNVLDLQHTIIKEEFSGRGYARALVAIVLERAWGREEHIIPTCSYVVDFLNRHPQYRHLLEGPTPAPRDSAAQETASSETRSGATATTAAATSLAEDSGSAGPDSDDLSPAPTATLPKGRHSA